MSINLNWAQTYAPAECERGKYVVIDSASLTTLGYPATGVRGKYAELVYVINTTGATSGSPIYNEQLRSNTIYVASNTYYSSATVVTPPAPLNKIEIYNNTNNSIAYFLPTSTTFTALTTQGIPINAYSYYSLSDVEVSQFTIGSDVTTNIRIVGHYRA